MAEEQTPLEDSQWEDYFEKIKIQNKEDANSLFSEIQQLLDAVNPLDLLTLLTHMTYYIREDENIHEYNLVFKLRDTPVIHFLAGLLLQKKEHDLSKGCITPEQLFVLVNKCISYLIKTSPYLNGGAKDDLDKYFTIQQHKETMRMTRPINPERYPHQTIHYLLELEKRVPDVFRERFSLTVKDFLNIGNQIKLYTVNRINKNLKDRVEQLKQIDINEPEVSNSQFVQEESDDKETSMDADFYGRYLIGCAMNDLLLIDLEGLATDCHLSTDEIIKFEQFLNLCSSVPGDQPEGSDVLIDNVLLSKPLIRWGSTYFCPAPADLVSALPVALEKLLEPDKLAKPPTRAWDRFQKAKANFVEDKAEECFRRIFKREHVYKNVKYDHYGNVEEADLLVPYDDKLIIVQAKSGSLSQAARRGAEQSLRNVIKKLIEEAYQQGLKVREYLESGLNPQFRLKDGSFAFAPRPGSSVKTEYIFINLTLEPLELLRPDFQNAL